MLVEINKIQAISRELVLFYDQRGNLLNSVSVVKWIGITDGKIRIKTDNGEFEFFVYDVEEIDDLGVITNYTALDKVFTQDGEYNTRLQDIFKLLVNDILKGCCDAGGGGGTQGLQDVLIVDPNLTQANTIDGGGFDQTITNVSKLAVESTTVAAVSSQSEVISDNAFLKTVDATTTAVAQTKKSGGFVSAEIRATDATGQTAVEAYAKELRIVTPKVDAGTAVLGQVATLKDAATGEVEYETPASGDNIYNSDGTLTADRTVDGDNFRLKFHNYEQLILSNSIDDTNTIIGSEAAPNNTGSSVNAIGPNTADTNSGSFINALGGNAATFNSGEHVNALGSAAAYSNSGDYVNALGLGAGQNNTYNHVNLLGENANATADGQTVLSKDGVTFERIGTTNLTASRLHEVPDADGTLVVTVNSIAADAQGNIVVPSGVTTYGALTDATTVDLPTVNVPLQTALDGKVDENAAIVGATKTKVTYDAKGLVTAGADATTADIADSTNKRYVTDAQQTVISNTSGTNTGDNAANTTSNAYADAKVADAIVDGVTTVAPSQNAVFDALAAITSQFQQYLVFNNPVSASSTRFFMVAGGTGATTELPAEIKIIKPCTITGLGIRTNSAQSGTGSLVITLRKNGANTAITFTIAAGSAAGHFSDTANSVSFAAGDTICIACVNNATATSATVLNGTIVGQ
jgi:hypothetical protein